MANTWKEKDFEEALHNELDELYKNILFGVRKVERSMRDSTGELGMKDQLLHIDSTIRYKNGSTLTVQEKTLQYKQLKYQSLTIEYFNDFRNKEKGEFFKCAAQCTLFAYRNEDNSAYSQIYLINNAYLRDKISRELDVAEYMRYNNAPAKSSFLAIPFEFFKDDSRIVMYSYTSDEAKEFLKQL